MQDDSLTSEMYTLTLLLRLVEPFLMLCVFLSAPRFLLPSPQYSHAWTVATPLMLPHNCLISIRTRISSGRDNFSARMLKCGDTSAERSYLGLRRRADNLGSLWNLANTYRDAEEDGGRKLPERYQH